MRLILAVLLAAYVSACAATIHNAARNTQAAIYIHDSKHGEQP